MRVRGGGDGASQARGSRDGVGLPARGPRGGRCRSLSAAILPLVISGLFATGALAVDLSGDLAGHLSTGLYRITDDIRVPAGQTLILDPGVIFEFEDSWWEEYEFDVEGTLLAEGTAAQPVVFRCASGVPEFNYLRIAGPASRLRHCRIERVGSVTALEEGGLWIDGASPLLEDCRITSATWHGIYVTGAAARPVIRRTEVTGSAADGIDADDGAGLELHHCTFRGNGGDGVCIASGGSLLVNCLIVDNGEDGVDSHGLDDYDADIVHCTIAANGGENLSDASAYRLFNSIVAGGPDDLALCRHSYVIADIGFLGFAGPAGGDWRLRADSPCREAGTPHLPAGGLPAVDLDGQPRRNGLLDLGAYESTAPPDPGTDGTWFSSALISPRMTHPEIRTRGESLSLLVAALGTYGPADVQAHLISPEGLTTPLTIGTVQAREAAPGTEWETRLYLPGVERIQDIACEIPAGAPLGLCDLDVSLGSHHYRSRHAVQVLASYPENWSMLHVTDTHVGYDEEEYSAAERLRFFVREANAVNPAFVVVTGDICENQNLENEAWADSFLAAVADLRVPVYVIPGNHDHYNEGGSYNPYGYFRYFQRINRVQTAEIRFGNARLYAFNAGHELGTLELYRCDGPTAAALDWAEARLVALNPAVNRPRFFLMHGPNYDYFSWNAHHNGRVRDLMDAHGVSLCLAGHTHRFETFRNDGENWFGRNDYSHEDDWGRDLPFPGYPLHVQTSSLGKEEHLPLPSPAAGGPAAGMPAPALAGPDTALVAAAASAGFVVPLEISEPHRRGLFGDDIGFRVIRVANGEVAFFTCDTDGDGYRNTEDAWLLGELAFSRETLPGGVIVSRVSNQHHENWPNIRHYISADPGHGYDVNGGTLVRRWSDGTLEVAVASLAAGGESVVTLTPATSSVAALAGRQPALRVLQNPFVDRAALRLQLPGELPGGHAAHAAVLRILDCTGREVRRIELAAESPGASLGAVTADDLSGGGTVGAPVLRLEWDGKDARGRPAPAGVYFVRLEAGGWREGARLVKLRG